MYCDMMHGGTIHKRDWQRAIARAAPVVSFVAPNAAITAGLSLTMAGLSFGSLDVTPSTAIGLTSCATAAWASSTSVRCLVAAGAGPSILTSVTVESVVGTRIAGFSFDGFDLLTFFVKKMQHIKIYMVSLSSQ